jgi:hypothetical protein
VQEEDGENVAEYHTDQDQGHPAHRQHSARAPWREFTDPCQRCAAWMIDRAFPRSHSILRDISFEITLLRAIVEPEQGILQESSHRVIRDS